MVSLMVENGKEIVPGTAVGNGKSLQHQEPAKAVGH
jgi:hypothetical protein